MTTAIYQPLGGGVHCIDALYTAPDLACCYLVNGGDEWAFVETGTARSVANILATVDALGIDRNAVRYVIPTHVHLDHAGGAGVLMREFPQAQLLIHPRGARHMVDPTRLSESARQVYGDELFATLYGEILAVESSRVSALEDGATVTLGNRRLDVHHMRGHADHHFCLFDEQTRGWFSGDMFGVSYRALRFGNTSYVMPATTPTQFEPALYCESVKALAAAEPAKMYLTHFGALPFDVAQAESLCRQLEAYARIGELYRDDPARLEREIIEVSRRELERLLTQAEAGEASRALTMDAKLNAQGIAWWQQHQRSAAG